MAETQSKERRGEMERKFTEHKLLSDGLQTTITDILLDRNNNPTVVLDSNEHDHYAIQLESIYDPDNGDDLVTLYSMFAADPNESISTLENQTVEITSSASDKSRTLTIQSGQQAVTGTVKEKINRNSLSDQLTDEQRSSLLIGHKNETTDGSVTSSQIENVKIKDSKIEIQTTDFTKTFEEEYTYSDDPETPYEKLIEYAGFGSIENLEGSNIYVTPKEKIQHRSKRFAIERLPDSWNVIDKTEDNEIITANRPTNGKFYQSKLLSKIAPKGINTVLLTLSAMAIINMLMLGIYTPSSGIPLYAAIFLIFSPIIPAVVLTVASRGYFVE